MTVKKPANLTHIIPRELCLWVLEKPAYFLFSFSVDRANSSNSIAIFWLREYKSCCSASISIRNIEILWWVVTLLLIVEDFKKSADHILPFAILILRASCGGTCLSYSTFPVVFFGRRTDQRTASNPLTPRPRSSINSHLDWRRSVCIWPIVFLFLPDYQMLDLFPVDLRMNKDLFDQLNQTQSNASLLDAISGIVNR